MTRAPNGVRIETTPATHDEWLPEARRLHRDGWWFEALWGRKDPQPEVDALFGRKGELRLLRLGAAGGEFPSLSTFIPAADWFERALRDRTGLVPRGHADPRPFLFHESYPAGYVEGQPLSGGPGRVASDYPFVRHEGTGVFDLPVGPIHAGVIEPGHFRFTTVGEIILDLEVRLNYTHKGTLTLARGRPVEHALRLLERLSGDNAAAHACAFAVAAEAALGVEPSKETQTWRTILVELERFYNHLGDLAGIAVDVAFAAAASQFQALREEMMRWNQRLFQHRLLMNTVAFDGLHAVPPSQDWDAFQLSLPPIRKRFEAAVEVTVNQSGLKERVEGTGQLSKSTAELLACVGPPARASGIRRDARWDAPCLAYPHLPERSVLRDQGTVSSRMWVKVEEARVVLDWLSGPLAHPGRPPPAATKIPTTPGDGIGLVEASRGAVLSWTRIRDGRVEDVYQRDPSFLNWRGLEEAVMRNIVPDFPLINKSFNLSYSGSDA